MTNDFWKKQETKTYPYTSYYFYSIKQWTQNTLAIESVCPGQEIKYYCWDYGGNNIFKFYSAYPVLQQQHIVGICNFITYPKNSFLCTNAQTGAEVWESEDIVEGLPRDIRVRRVLVSESDTHLEFICSYTLSDGAENSIRLKLQKDTGEIEKE